MKNIRLHPQRWILAVAVIMPLMLPGCSTPAPSDIAVNPITVKSVQLTHTVHFAPGSAVLAPSEADSLRNFLRDGGGASVNAITLASGASPIADARRARVSQAIDALGMSYSVAPADPNFTADAVQVAVTGEAAIPPACPNWTVVGPYDPSNAPLTNLGCATHTNLYLMVADPRDLVSGHALTPADAEPSMRAVEAYRTGDQKANPQAPSLGSSDGGSGGSGSTTGGSNGQ